MECLGSHRQGATIGGAAFYVRLEELLTLSFVFEWATQKFHEIIVTSNVQLTRKAS